MPYDDLPAARVSVRLKPGPARVLDTTPPRTVAETKASPAFALHAVGGQGQPAWTPRRYDRLADEGYILNVVAHRCIALVARGIASLQWYLKGIGGDRASDEHPWLELMRRPNPMQRGASFWYGTSAFLSLAGNSYLERIAPGRSAPPKELWLWRPDRVQIFMGSTGLPDFFRYETAIGRHDVPVDPVTGESDVLHLRAFHPLSDWYGLGGVEVGARSIDQHNAAGEHNQALLQQGARPSGLLIFKDEIGEIDRERAETKVNHAWAGIGNAGKMHVLGGEWEFINTSITPKDMDFEQGTYARARDICAAFGVPHVLVVPGESTYSNRDQAWLELWEQTIIPAGMALRDDLDYWLGPRYGGRVRLEFDRDTIAALIPRQTAHRAQVVTEYEKGIITRDEAREALGYDPVGGEDGEKFATDAPPMVPGQVPGQVPGKKPGQAGAKPAAKKADDMPVETKAAGEFDDLPDGELIAEMQPVIAEIVRYFGQRVFDDLKLQIAFDVLDPAVVEFIEQWGATRIKQLVGTTTREQLAATMAEGVRGGESTPKLMRRIMDVFEDASRQRAKMIAETEVTIAAGFGAQKGFEQSGAEYKQWLATADGRVRDTHRAMDGQIRRVQDPFFSPSGAKGMYPGGFGVGSEDIYCFPGETCALPIGHMKTAYRRPYQGPLVTIETSAGRKLTGTPNHPILTTRGWIALGALKNGDDLICYGVEVGEVATACAGVNPDEGPAELSKIFHLATKMGLCHRIAGHAPDFHGDGKEGEIEVVLLGRILAGEVSAAEVERGQHLGLMPAGMGHSHVAGDGTSATPLDRLGGPSKGSVSGGSKGLALLGARPAHPHEHGIATATDLDAGCNEVASDDMTIHAERTSKRLLALAGLISSSDFDGVEMMSAEPDSVDRYTGLSGDAGLTKAVGPEGIACAELGNEFTESVTTPEELDTIINAAVQADFDGHVFTLETSTGLFVANGIVVSNCRCASLIFVPGIDGDLPKELEGKAEHDARLEREWRRWDNERAVFDGHLAEAARRGFERQQAWCLRRLTRAQAVSALANEAPGG